MQVKIEFRAWTGKPALSIEIGAEFESASTYVQIGAAVKVALGSGAVLRGAVLSGADLRGAVLSGADLRGAVLRGAVLRDADLRGAVLRDAVLRGADLRGAVLRDADLRGADLSDAVLRGADLRGAVLRGADLRGVTVVPNIDAAILAAIEAGGTLDMGDWHRCETTHCRAGWAITLAGEAGAKLEELCGPASAGSLIYAASRPGKNIPDFYASTEDALADLRACAAEQA